MSERNRSKRLGLTPAMAALVVAFGAIAPAAGAAPAGVSQCSAANQKSIKLRTNHKLIEARDQAVLCSATTCSAVVRAACKKRAAALDAAIPTIIFLAKDQAGRDLSEVRVSMDGASLADRLDGTALSVDPGQHTFTFEVSGQTPVDQSFLINQKEKDRRETITLTVPPPPPPVAVVAATPSEPGADTGTSSSRGPLRTAAFVLGGVGVASLVAGGVTGGLAISKWHSSESECGSATQCPDHAQSVGDHNAASTLATISTVTVIVGGVALATGVTLFFVAPRRTEQPANAGAAGAFLEFDPILGPGTGGMALKGVF
jgi:hypothetical protein